MEILNIGPLELVLILVIALIVLGPEEMVRTARSLARGISKFIHSPVWKSLVSTSQEIRQLPKKFIAEAGLDETMDELNRMNKQARELVRSNPLEPAKKTAQTGTETDPKKAAAGGPSRPAELDPEPKIIPPGVQQNPPPAPESPADAGKAQSEPAGTDSVTEDSGTHHGDDIPQI